MDVYEFNCNSAVKYTPHQWVGAGKASPEGTFNSHAIGQSGTVERWDHDANLVDISQASPSLATVAWYWHCPWGHRWKEPLHHVNKKAKWKRLDPDGPTSAACRQCLLENHAPTFTGCGHTVRDLGLVTRSAGSFEGARCSDCRDAKMYPEVAQLTKEQRQEKRRQRKAAFDEREEIRFAKMRAQDEAYHRAVQSRKRT